MEQQNALIKIVDLKATLMDVIESAFAGQSTTPDIAATQQMGVNLTNAVKREGVTIIQNQSVEVYARIMPPIIRAMKMCDGIESAFRRELDQQIETRVIELKPAEVLLPAAAATPAADPAEDDDPIEACCEWLYENRINWHEMQTLIKKRYLNHVIGKEGTKIKAARMLGVGPTYLSKLTHEQEGHDANPNN